MRLLITGIHGLLGSNLARVLSSQGHTIIGSGRRSEAPPEGRYIPGDLSDPHFASRLVAESEANAIINTVGLADVNECEKDPKRAHLINARTAGFLAREAAARHLRFLHISTDHLFTGTRANSTEDDPPAPLNAYGRSKREGEIEVLAQHPGAVVVRTNFFGWSPAGHSPTFAEWLFNSLQLGTPITLFTDYYFNSIEVTSLAHALLEVLLSDYRGILNIGSVDRVSKYDFGKEMASRFGLSFDHVTAAPYQPSSLHVARPQDLSLSVERFQSLFRTPLPTLRSGLIQLHQSWSGQTVNKL